MTSNTTNEKTGYPLCWPEGRPRTPRERRRHAPFRTSFAQARDNLIREIKLLGGSDNIFSSDIPRKNDGMPYADSKPRSGDTGIAVYFTRKGRQLCFACDCYHTVDDNMQAIAKTIEALRGIARWGTGDMMEAAFRGFTALPESVAEDWWKVLGVPVNCDRETALAKFRELVRKHHPDGGDGDTVMFVKVMRAKEELDRLPA